MHMATPGAQGGRGMPEADREEPSLGRGAAMATWGRRRQQELSGGRGKGQQAGTVSGVGLVSAAIGMC